MSDEREVLTEMGGRRLWWCELSDSFSGSSRKSCESHPGSEGIWRCGWVWVVKEDGDE